VNRCIVGAAAFAAALAVVVSPAAARAAAPPAVQTALAHHAVSTRSADAQHAFDEGLTLLYAFNRDEARARFERAASLDPSLAIAWWGVAVAMGPNLNFDLDAKRLAVARGALAKAKALEANASPEERAYIDAVAVRYPATATGDTDATYAAYREAMGRLHDAYPADDDAATLYAESIMDTQPWSWSDGKPEGSAAQLASLLEGVLAHDPQHVGANHYYVHLMDEQGVAIRALPSAERLAALPAEPAASHLVHMAGHTFIDVGDYAALERANRTAVEDDLAYSAAMKESPTELDYYGHNLDFYIGGAVMRGDAEEADRAIGFARQVGSVRGMFGLEREGRYAEALAWPAPAAKSGLNALLYPIARGLAYIALGNAAAARAQLAAYDDATGPETDDRRGVYLHAVHHVLAARLADMRGDDVSAARILREAIERTQHAPPEAFAPWTFPMRSWLGWIVLKGGDPRAAEVAFHDALAYEPNDPQALFGLMESISQQGRVVEARPLAARIASIWRGPVSQLRPAGL
jgi:tetratricopeptide (TPR) repeat protein